MCIHICLIHKMHLERHCKITHWLPLGKELLGTGIKGRFFSLVESWINIFKIQRLDGKLADKIANIIKSSTQQLEISLELQIQSKKCLLNISQGLAQCFFHDRSSIHICWMDEKLNGYIQYKLNLITVKETESDRWLLSSYPRNRI